MYLSESKPIYPDSILKAVKSRNPELFLPRKWQFLKVETLLHRPKSWSLESAPLLNDPRAAIKFISELLADLDQSDRERLYSIFVDNSLRVVGVHEVTVGSATETLAPPRELFKAAIVANANGLFFIHNHPSGRLEFSTADKTSLERLKRVAQHLDIRLLDFIVIGLNGQHIAASEQELL